MTLRPGWPAVSGTASQFDIRAGLRATVAQDAAGNVKTGVAVNAQTQSALVSARTDMKVNVAAFDAVLDRYGPVFVRHDGVDQVTLDAAPTANQRIDSIWVRQQETASPVSDAANGPVFGVAKGTASTSPVAPAIPAGAMRLADVQIPSTATATNSSGVTITQRYDFTAAQGAPLTFRTKTDMQAWAGWDGQKARVIADPTTANNGDYVWSGGSAWKPCATLLDVSHLLTARGDGVYPIEFATATLNTRTRVVTMSARVRREISTSSNFAEPLIVVDSSIMPRAWQGASAWGGRDSASWTIFVATSSDGTAINGTPFGGAVKVGEHVTWTMSWLTA